MNIKVVEKKTNKLLDRLEVQFEIESKAETPKRLEVKSKLAALINADEKLVVIKAIHQQAGTKNSVGVAHAYKDMKTLQYVEPKHLIKRNNPEQKEGEK